MSTSTWYWFYLQQAGGKRGFVEFWFMNDRLSSRSRNVSCTHTSMYEIRVYEQDSLNMSKLVFSCLSFHNIPHTFMVMALVPARAECRFKCWGFWCCSDVLMFWCSGCGVRSERRRHGQPAAQLRGNCDIISALATSSTDPLHTGQPASHYHHIPLLTNTFYYTASNDFNSLYILSLYCVLCTLYKVIS